MKYKSRKKGIAIGAAALLVFALIIFQERNTRLMLTLFPPGDLYKDLVDSKIDLDGHDNGYEFIYQQKYVGTYMYGVRIEKLPPVGEALNTSAVIDISVNESGKVVYCKYDLPWSGRFGSNDSNSGVIFGYFKVPDDVSLSDNVKINVKIRYVDPSFGKKYGSTHFFVTRATDL